MLSGTVTTYKPPWTILETSVLAACSLQRIKEDGLLREFIFVPHAVDVAVRGRSWLSGRLPCLFFHLR